MKIPFDIKFRPQIESGEYKVETEDGRHVRIICWDLKHDFFCLVGLVGSENELIFQYTEKGRFYPDTRTKMDLVLVIPEEPELTEFEKKVCEILYSDKPEYSASDDDSWKHASAELLELAEKTLSTKYKFSSDMNGFAYGTGYEAGKEEALKELQENLAFNDIFRVPEWLREILVMTKENGKKEALNDLPRWKQVDVNMGNGISAESNIVPRSYDSEELCFCYEGNYLLLSELKKLPGYKEE